MKLHDKLIMNLQLFAHKKGEDNADTTEQQMDTKDFIDSENIFSSKDDEVPDWLKDDDGEEEVDETEETTEDEATDQADPEETETEEVDEAEPETIKRDTKADKAFAEMRREVKQLKAQAKANDKWAKDNFNLPGMQEYRVKMDNQIIEETKRELEEKGYDVEAIQQAMLLNPNLKAIMESAKPSTEEPEDVEEDVESEEEAAAIQKAKEDKIVADYIALNAKYPDLVPDPESIPKEVWDMYDAGSKLVDAFEIINNKAIAKKISKKTKEMTKQATLNNLNSKKHLKTDNNNGGNATDVIISPEKMANYRSMGVSEKQAMKFEKQFMK